MTTPSTLALIVAAGRGERLGGALPKAYVPLLGEPMLRRTVRRFLAQPGVDGVRVVVGEGDLGLYDDAVAGLGLEEPIVGGATRQASVRLGLETLAGGPPGRVLIQDAARPLASPALIGRVMAALDGGAEAVLPALPVVDSLRRVEGGRLLGEAPRDGLVRAQTPQGFRFAPILEAHRRFAGEAATDDAALARAAGLEAVIVAGEEDNLKVTHEADIARAERLLAPRWRWRTGTGFDVHAFAAGRPCIVGGVTIPHPFGLLGHSDADVGLHALTDAILGAASAGDIGAYFPPSDPRWKDADSALFLQEALAVLHAKGGVLEHVDLTVICERPKIGPHRDAIRARIGGLLGLPPDGVSVKATTTEGLGFAGRGEGIAAQAAATVRLPWASTDGDQR
ncbi:MAG: 2-C-methyl-D-erythritol 2,4-cyclodiphosphate synthase [Geminicoccaceae bacterium]|nr:2-C-methyl-D-erythritol 2,4-cyclodiphosphate synthase [Geminicoccaceae bacterium]